MFEDSMMESAGKTPSNSKWMIVGSMLLQTLALIALLLYPILYPEALPPLTTTDMLVAPPQSQSPPAPRSTQPPPAVRPAVMMLNIASNAAHLSLRAATSETSGLDNGPPQDVGFGDGPLLIGVADGMPNIAPAPPSQVIHPALKGPVRISSGLAAGQLLNPIRPEYPALARATHVQGVVVVEATISRNGTIENVRVISGPAVLQRAAVSAISAARYKPFLLDGAMIEVETTINVVFTLGSS